MAVPYSRSEAKERAREQWHGACNVTLPSFSQDFTGLDEEAIRNDIRHSAKLGFWGTLVASESGTTPEEYVRFMELAAEAAPEGFKLVAHPSTNTLEEMVPITEAAESFGFEAALPAYPTTFVPKSAADVVEFTREFASRTDLALILFGVMTWGFRSITPQGFPHEAIVELADVDTVVAVKYEASPPGIVTGVADMVKKCGEKIIVECPMEMNAPALMDWFGMQWIGTSGYESFGDRVPRWFKLISEGKWDEAMEIYWSYQALREAKGAVTATTVGANLIHRPMWKYLGWLHGYNGGLLRMPQMRLQPGQMARLRAGAEASGYEIPADDSGFYAGRTAS